MNKIYFLSTCSSCKKIISFLDIKGNPNFLFQDIKTANITPEQIEQMRIMCGSYEELFSRRAIKYKELNLKDKILKEEDYRDLILNDYTFLKRPVCIVNNEIFIGNSPKNIAALKFKIHN